jgi:hypothetical protein
MKNKSNNQRKAHILLKATEYHEMGKAEETPEIAQIYFAKRAAMMEAAAILNGHYDEDIEEEE